jgi:uncharacterized protein YkwD
MTARQRLARLASGAGLAGLALIAISLAVAAKTAASAPASSTPAVLLPVIDVPPGPTPAAFLPVIDVAPPPTPTGTPLPVTPPAATDWQTVLQYYRASAHLPVLAVNAGWSVGAANHAHYMVGNDVLAYTEVTGTPWYSPAGATEAANSILMLSDTFTTTDQQALDFWMAKPFHALGLLNPALLTTGFGSFREDDGIADIYRMGAVADVRQGLGFIPSSVSFPINWPGHNSTVYLTSYDGNEQPDPLTSCPGYGAPSGLPILLQVGPGGSSFVVGAHTIQQGNTSLPHCAFTSSTYTNSFDPALQTLGRQILAASDAIVLIPQQPLVHGLSYTVSVVVNSQTLVWTFNVAP